MISLSDRLTYELDLAIVFDVIEGGVDSGRLSVEDSKLAAVGLPCKCNDAFWKNKNTKDNWVSFFLIFTGKQAVTLCACTYMFLPFISTTSTGTCFSLMRKISKLVTTPWKRQKTTFSIWFFATPGLCCFLSYSPLSVTCVPLGVLSTFTHR